MTPDHEAAKREFRELPTDLGNTVRVPHAATVKFFDWIWDHSAHPEGGPVVMSVDLTPADIANQAAEFFLGASLAPQASGEGDELDRERKQVEQDHLCDCDTCQRSNAICPASAGTLIDELAQRRIAMRRVAPASAPMVRGFSMTQEEWDTVEAATPPAAPSDGAMVVPVIERGFVIHGRKAYLEYSPGNGWAFHSDDHRGSMLNSDGKWESYRGERKHWPDRAACLEFLASLSGEQTPPMTPCPRCGQLFEFNRISKVCEACQAVINR